MVTYDGSSYKSPELEAYASLSVLLDLPSVKNLRR